MLDRLVCKGWVERLPNPNDKRGVLVKLTTSGAAICEQCHQLVGQDLHQELNKLMVTKWQHLSICLRKSCRKQKRGMTMSRRNTDAITIHSILGSFRTTWNRHCHWRKCQSVQVTLNGTQVMFKKETGHSLGQYIRSRKYDGNRAKAEGK